MVFVKFERKYEKTLPDKFYVSIHKHTIYISRKTFNAFFKRIEYVDIHIDKEKKAIKFIPVEKDGWKIYPRKRQAAYNININLINVLPRGAYLIAESLWNNGLVFVFDK